MLYILILIFMIVYSKFNNYRIQLFADVIHSRDNFSLIKLNTSSTFHSFCGRYFPIYTSYDSYSNHIRSFFEGRKSTLLIVVPPCQRWFHSRLPTKTAIWLGHRNRISFVLLQYILVDFSSSRIADSLDLERHDA